MARFAKTRSFGRKFRLTDRQEQALIGRVNAAGLTCSVEHCWTGSIYVAIDLPTWSCNINGEWYNDLDCGCGDGIAKIRLSCHDEGRRVDSTHNAVGTKGECMAALNRWIDTIVEKHGPEGRRIIAAWPPAK